MIIRSSNIPKTIQYPSKLKKCSKSTNLMHITSNIRYLSGFVKTNDNIPIANSIISFTSIECSSLTNNNENMLLGYTKTDSRGYFSFYIDLYRIPGNLFKLEIFNPLTKEVISACSRLF